jgi:hypothetical protein
MRLLLLAAISLAFSVGCNNTVGTTNPPPQAPNGPSVQTQADASQFNGMWAGNCSVTSPDHSHDNDTCVMEYEVDIEGSVLTAKADFEINGVVFPGGETDYRVLSGGALHSLTLNVGSMTSTGFTITDNDSSLTFTLVSPTEANFSKTALIGKTQITGQLQKQN